MKIVCICNDEATVNRIFDGVASHHEVSLVIVPKFTFRKRKRAKKLTLSTFFAKAIGKVFFKFVTIKPNPKLTDQYFHNNKWSTKRDASTDVAIIATTEMNNASTAELIASHEPDVLFVCGAPILKNNIFEIPKYGSINFHFGYSPKYRGQHTNIWAFNQGDYQNIAGTFLKIDKGIDTGNPLCFVHPEITGCDTIESIESKIADLASQNASKVVDALEAETSIASPSHPDAVNVKYTDYTTLTHLKYECRHWLNRLFQKRRTLQAEKIVLPDLPDAQN